MKPEKNFFHSTIKPEKSHHFFIKFFFNVIFDKFQSKFGQLTQNQGRYAQQNGTGVDRFFGKADEINERQNTRPEHEQNEEEDD